MGALYLSSGRRKTLFSMHLLMKKEFSRKLYFSLQRRDTLLSFGQVVQNIIGQKLAKGENSILVLEQDIDCQPLVDCHGHVHRIRASRAIRMDGPRKNIDVFTLNI